jgi:hypothetical protein
MQLLKAARHLRLSCGTAERDTGCGGEKIQLLDTLQLNPPQFNSAQDVHAR